MGCVCGKESLQVDGRRIYVKQRLGEGGFSFVDLVEDSTTREPLALKRILCHGEEEERVAMAEVEVMQAVKHPNLIPLEGYCVRPNDNHYSKARDITCEVFLLIPLYKNGTLQNQIDTKKLRGDHFPEADIWNLMRGICEGVKALHIHNPPYAHRDLKPDNVMTETDNTPIVMDLGSAALARVKIETARQATQLQDTAAERCSMLYRAPELFTVETNTTLDERLDVWSLGCVLYALAFLESPFENAYQRGDSLALATMAGKITFPQNHSYSSSVVDTISWMLKPNPKERPFITELMSRIESFETQDSTRI